MLVGEQRRRTGGRLPPLHEVATAFVKPRVGAATCRPCPVVSVTHARRQTPV